MATETGSESGRAPDIVTPFIHGLLSLGVLGMVLGFVLGSRDAVAAFAGLSVMLCLCIAGFLFLFGIPVALGGGGTDLLVGGLIYTAAAVGYVVLLFVLVGILRLIDLVSSVVPL